MSRTKADVQYKFTDFSRRSKFRIQIAVCDELNQGQCESNEKMNILLQNIVFELFMTVGEVELGNIDNYGYDPVKNVETIISQFSISTQSYREEFHLIRINKVTTKDERWKVLSPAKKFRFYDIQK
jgi:hypothetical protein